MSDHSTGRWEFVTAAQIGEAWWAEWDFLCNTCLDAHPALAAAFVALLIKHFNPGSLLYATLRQNGAALVKTLLLADSMGRWRLFRPDQAVIAPLVFDRRKACDPLLISSLLSQLPGLAWKLDFLCQDPRFSWVADSRPERALTTDTWSSASIQAPHGFDAYWQQRPKHFREELGRKLRRIAKQGHELIFRVLTTPVEVTAGVDRYAGLEGRGWKGRAGTALHPENAQGRFYGELLQTLAASGNGRVMELYLGDRLAASRLVISGRNRHLTLKTTFDEELSAYSVGHLNLRYLLQELLAGDASATVELCTHASREQLWWASSAPQISNVSVYRNGGVKQLFALRHGRRKSAVTA